MTPLSLFEKPKSKAKRVEEALRSAGLGGVSNVALNHITFRYGAVIHDLRHNKGHHIVTGPTDKNGLVRYYWHY